MLSDSTIAYVREKPGEDNCSANGKVGYLLLDTIAEARHSTS